MDILLIVSDRELRQLYHELLLSPTDEVIPADDAGDALLLLTLKHYKTAVIYVDDNNSTEIEAFLRLCEQHKNLSMTKIAFITDGNFHVGSNRKQDLVLNSQNLPIDKVAEAIKKHLRTP